MSQPLTWPTRHRFTLPRTGPGAREFADRGELLMIGPFDNAQEDGAMGIFTTRQAAEEFVGGDPFVLHGVVRNWTIREWNEALVPDQRAEAGD